MTICVPQVNALMLNLTTGHNSEFQTRKKQENDGLLISKFL